MRIRNVLRFACVRVQVVRAYMCVLVDMRLSASLSDIYILR